MLRAGSQVPRAAKAAGPTHVEGILAAAGSDTLVDIEAAAADVDTVGLGTRPAAAAVAVCAVEHIAEVVEQGTGAMGAAAAVGTGIVVDREAGSAALALRTVDTPRSIGDVSCIQPLARPSVPANTPDLDKGQAGEEEVGIVACLRPLAHPSAPPNTPGLREGQAVEVEEVGFVPVANMARAAGSAA